MMRWIVGLFLLLSTLTSGATTFKSITLQHKTAASIESLVKPLLPKDCAISGQGYQLIVKCQTSDLAPIASLVQSLDIPAQNLVIRFKRVQNADYNLRREYGDIDVYSTQPDSNQTQDRTIAVEDGHEAYISAGTSFPYKDFYVQFYGAGSVTRYKDLLSGFTVLPQVHGSNVKLTINWQYENQDKVDTAWEREHGVIHQEQSSTVINLPLGQWQRVSQFGTSSETPPDTRVYDTRNVSDPKTNLLIRVDLATTARHARPVYPE